MADRKPSIRMHYGACHNEIIVDGTVFNRSTLSHPQFTRFKTIVIDALIKVGFVKRRKKFS